MLSMTAKWRMIYKGTMQNIHAKPLFPNGGIQMNLEFRPKKHRLSQLTENESS